MLMFLSFLLSISLADEKSPGRCKNKAADKFLRQGFSSQKDSNTDSALESYKKCLELEPDCVACLYEIGWSYWKLGQWNDVIDKWKIVLKLEPDHDLVHQYLPTAHENLALISGKHISTALRRQTPLLTRSLPKDAPVQLTFTARHQSYNPKPLNPLDTYDLDIDSPKSALFSSDGKAVFVNSLEGSKTIIYDSQGFKKLGVISHKFTAEDGSLFDNSANFHYSSTSNVFSGKPVEMVTTHGGKYLWVTYYRRNYDPNGVLPSAMALIDVKAEKIVRVFATGPIAKYVEVSPSGKYLAVSHWGDNTVGLFDISGDDPARFHAVRLFTVDKQLDLKDVKGDRDRNCGFCVRGLAFTKDENYLFVGRMRKGGIAVFDLQSDVKSPGYVATVFGISPGPRDIHVSKDGKWLFMSCNATGFVSKIPVDRLIQAALSSKDKTTRIENDQARRAFVGLGARSMKLSPDDKYLFVSVNHNSELLAVRTNDMKVISRIPVDSYPVGLALSPSGTLLWATSQGHNGQGGNSVGAYLVRYKGEEAIVSAKPTPPK